MRVGLRWINRQRFKYNNSLLYLSRTFLKGATFDSNTMKSFMLMVALVAVALLATAQASGAEMSCSASDSLA